MKLPDSIDLRKNLPIFHQGDLGSSIACALTSAMMLQEIGPGPAPNPDSRLLLYYHKKLADEQ